jgi:murein L,D-transpeptidase YcbB/YkuD
MKKKNEALVDELKQVMTSEPEVEAEEFDTAVREALRAQRTALSGLLRDGVITDETYSHLIVEVDEALMDKNPSARFVE